MRKEPPKTRISRPSGPLNKEFYCSLALRRMRTPEWEYNVNSDVVMIVNNDANPGEGVIPWGEVGVR
jgi:hypothetical protein